MTRTTFLPSGHLTLSHLKTFARSAELRPPTVFVLSTTTAICRAAHVAPRQSATKIVVKIRLGIVSKSTDQGPRAASYCGNRCFLYIGLGKDREVWPELGAVRAGRARKTAQATGDIRRKSIQACDQLPSQELLIQLDFVGWARIVLRVSYPG